MYFVPASPRAAATSPELCRVCALGTAWPGLGPCSKATCAIVMLGSATTLLFGRGVVAIVQGVVGVLFALEGYYGARKVSRRIIGFFLLYLALNTVAR